MWLVLYLGSKAQILGIGGKQLVSKLAGLAMYESTKELLTLLWAKQYPKPLLPGVYERWMVA